MSPRRLLIVCAAGAIGLLAACDDDPTSPPAPLAFLGCPTGPLETNASIGLDFSLPLRASTVSPANVIVSNAATGLEIPGALALSESGTRVTFAPSSQLPFGEVLAIRVQNIVSAEGSSPLGVVVCNVATAPPPIAEVVWSRLDSPTGTDLVGASLYGPDSGWVASIAVPLYRRMGSGWEVRFNQPYFLRSHDVDFVSSKHGFGSHLDQRRGRGVITRTTDGGVTFDTVFTLAGQDIQRLHIDSSRAGGRLFGVAGGGSAVNARFLKLNAAGGTFSDAGSFSNTATINDIDFTPGDTVNGYAVSNGVVFLSNPPIIYPGRLFRTTNGGSSWTEVTAARADTLRTFTYRGVARRANGDVFVTGGNGFVARFPGGGGPGVVIDLGVASRDTTDFRALIYHDVQFAPDNDLFGWIVGAQLLGVVDGVPRYQGLIFRTSDGGSTWIRQGVIGAEDYGGLFPGLNRLDVFSSTEVWAVGEAGTVLSLNP